MTVITTRSRTYNANILAAFSDTSRIEARRQPTHVWVSVCVCMRDWFVFRIYYFRFAYFKIFSILFTDCVGRSAARHSSAVRQTMFSDELRCCWDSDQRFRGRKVGWVWAAHIHCNGIHTLHNIVCISLLRPENAGLQYSGAPYPAYGSRACEIWIYLVGTRNQCHVHESHTRFWRNHWKSQMNNAIIRAHTFAQWLAQINANERNKKWNEKKNI